jgi:hypothetical protein
LTAVPPLRVTTGLTLLTVTAWVSVWEPRSSSATVTLSVLGSDAVAVGLSSAKLQPKLPAPVVLLIVALAAT